MTSHLRMRNRAAKRHDRETQGFIHDPYREAAKKGTHAVCPECGVFFDHGQWHWGHGSKRAEPRLCPACKRVNDASPAGLVTLEGDYFNAHRDDILSLVWDEADRSMAEHPLERIMSIDGDEHSVTVCTTDLHLAKQLGDALYNAFRGEVQTQYAAQEYFVKVHWAR